MSVTLAEGVVKVTADARGVGRDVAEEVGRTGPMEDAGRRSAGAFGGVFRGSLLGSFMGNIASDIVGQIGYAVGAGIRQAVEFGMGGIDIASGVAEAKTAIASIFGEGSTIVESFAKDAAGAIGQSNLDALKAAQNFGVFGKAAGLAAADNAAFSATLVQTASDFASFYDTSPEDAIIAIGAALRGEYEPIRNYGLLLDEASLKQQAMAMGIYDGEGALTQQQKVLAANALIVSDANASYNDFAETSGGLANQQRTLQAELENAQGALGEALLPAMLELTTFANDTLVPILNDVIEVVGPILADALTEAAPAFLDMVESIVPHIPELIRLGTEAFPIIMEALGWLIPVLTDIGTAFSDSTMPEWPGLVTIIGDALQGFSDKLVVGQEQVFSFFGQVGESFTTGMGQIGDFFAVVGESFTTGMGQIGDFAGSVGVFFGQIGGTLAAGAGNVGAFFGQVGASISYGIGEFGRFVGEVANNVGQAISWVASLPGRALSALGDLGSLLFSQGQNLIRGFIRGIEGMIGSVGDAIGGVLDFAAGFFPNSPAERGPFSGSGWTAIGRSGLAIGEQFASGLERARFGIPFTTTYGEDFARAGMGSLTAAPTLAGATVGGVGGGRGDQYVTITVNEARDPLGSTGRVATELRRWAKR